MKNISYPTYLLLAATLLCGCIESMDPEADDAAEFRIHAPDFFDNHAHPAVTVLATPYGRCTGTLIASNVILTAAHCVGPHGNQDYDVHVVIGHNAGPQLRSDLLDVPGIEPRDPNASLAGVPTITVDTTNVILHPLWDAFATWDVALVVLDTPVPRNLVTPVPVLDAGVYPSPPVSPSLQGLNQWNGIYVQILGGGDINEACDGGAPSEISILESLVYEPLFAEGGFMYQMQGGADSPGPSICGGDSGGPIVATPNASFGINLPHFEIISIMATADTAVRGPVLNGGAIRPWLVAHGLDADGDGIEAADDNCDRVANPQQEDNDGDHWGDDCDTDDDNDGIPDEDDNCPQDANPGQEDWDHDGRGWACDFDEHDLDNDHVPNAVDNCPFNANPHQENCNALAETLALFGSDGSVTGDACDPAPCATTKALVSQFVGHSLSPAGSAHNPCLRESGRTIENVLDVRPMRAADFSPVTTDELEVWFCPCEASDAEACADPPWNCAHEHASAQPPGSNWRRITLDAAQPLSTTYEPWVQHPQPSELYTWDYVSDYNAWVIEEQLWTPTPNSVQLYGPGTDMRGILRVDDPTTEGAYAHFFGCADCSLSLHYVADVRPDRATSRLDCMTVPISTAPPYWTYCPECIDGYELPYEHLSYPALFSTVGDDVVLWTNEQPGTEPTGYAMDISDTFSAELRDVMNDERFRIVAPSEPIDSALQPGQTRAFVMTADATTMVGEIDLSEEGFELRHFDAQTPISARSGHATAYSLEADSLFVAGGLENDGTVIPELWQRSVDGDWSRVDLEQHLAPVAAHSAMVSAADRHLWVIDQRGDQLVVLRINPSGQGGQTMRLTSLRNGPAQAWLLQRATGEVLAVVATDSSYEVVHLGYDTRSGRLEVVASARADGEIAAAPIIKNGTLSLGLAHSDDVRSWIEPTDAPRLAARRR